MWKACSTFFATTDCLSVGQKDLEMGYSPAEQKPTPRRRPRLNMDLPDVFLSYSWQDKSVVDALDQYLRDAGFRILRDERSFVPGRRLQSEIQRIVQQVKIIVAAYSAASADRPWPKVEREIAEDRRVQEGDHKCSLIYFRLDATPLPNSETARLAINAYQFQGPGAFKRAADDLCRSLLGKEATPMSYDWKSLNKLKNPWT